VVYDSYIIANLEEKQKENPMDTKALAEVIDKTLLVESGCQTAREVLLE
jgi:hypothetical protein